MFFSLHFLVHLFLIYRPLCSSKIRKFLKLSKCRSSFQLMQKVISYILIVIIVYFQFYFPESAC